MEKVKITVSKIVNTKPDKYGFSVRVKATEYGDSRIFMIGTKQPESIKEGGVYEGEATLWKKGEDNTEWWSWKWPKKEGGANNGEVLAKLSSLSIGQDLIAKDVKTLLSEIESIKPYLVEALGLVKVGEKPASKIPYRSQEEEQAHVSRLADEEFDSLDDPANQ